MPKVEFAGMRTLTDNLEDPDDVRTRIVVTAYDLFAHRGIRDVGVDELIRASGVAKARRSTGTSRRRTTWPWPF